MTVISMIGDANVFIIMFMIGMQIELKFSLRSLASISKIILVRYGFAVLFALAVQLLPIPMDPACRTALTVVVFAPLSSVTTVFSQELGCDTNVAALAGSISMPISVCAFVALLIFLA